MSENHFAAGGVVVKQEEGKTQVLLVKDSYGHWTWPKGHMELEETAEETALREVQEETGLKTLSILEKLGTQEYWYTLKDVKIFKTVYIFLVEASGGEPIIIQKEELEKGEWFSPEEALETIEYKGSKEILKKAIERYMN